MFEQYISDWLTSYLGHFLDIKSENLRANILSAFSEPAGLTLRDVKLKTEALDFFQLPVAVEEAVVGSLHVRCPWGLRGRNIVELSDVYICVSPRTEADWEEGPAQRRAYATKRAQLSAAETSMQLTGSSSGQKGGYGWAFLTWGGSVLLNKLQFRMKRTHICFKVPKGTSKGHGTEFGMHLGLVETGYEDRKVKVKTKESNPAKQAAKILKDIVVQQLSLYWKAGDKDESPSKTSSMDANAWQHVEHPVISALPPDASSAARQPLADADTSESPVSADRDAADVVLLPTKCELTISMSTDKQTGVTHIGASAKVDRLQVQVHQEQINDMVFMQDQYAVWLLRNQYAALRPTGWQSSIDKAVPPRRLWQFAIHAVLQDLGKHWPPQRLSGESLLHWRSQRQLYTDLWRRKLQLQRQKSSPVQVEAEQQQIEALEMHLLVPNILFFRHLAGRALKKQISTKGSNASSRSEGTTASNNRPSLDLAALEDQGSATEEVLKEVAKDSESPHASSTRQGWWTWGLSGASSILGYVPSKEQLHRPTQAEMQQLDATLSLDPHNLPDGRDSARKLELEIKLTVASASVILSDSNCDGEAKRVAACDLEQLIAKVQLSPEATHTEVTLQEMSLLDLTDASASTADTLLTRLQQPGSISSSSEVVEHGSGNASPGSSTSLSNSFVVIPQLQHDTPILRLQYDEHKAQEAQQDPSTVAPSSPVLQVWVEALHITHQPVCWARLSGLVSGGPKDTQAARLTQATTLLDSPEAQMVAQSHRFISTSVLPAITVQIQDVVLVMGQEDQSGGCSILHSGAIKISREPQPNQLVQQQQQALLRLQQHISSQHCLAASDVEQLLVEVQTSILYHRLHVSLDGIQLSTSNCTSSLSSRDTAVLSPCRCTAGLDLHRTSGDTLLPGTKACIQLDSVHVQLNPSSVAVINQSLLQLCSAPASDDLTEPPEAQHKGVPLAEVNIVAGAISVTFDDSKGQDSDCSNTHLKLRGQKLDLLLEFVQGAVAAKGTVLQLHATDRSKYTSKIPKIYGCYSVPRLAQVMTIDNLTVRVDHSQADGLLVSGRLSGAAARGWPSESGNIISRLTSSIPAQGVFTYYDTTERLQTSITLQDGCFGTATLMRIAALFMPTPTLLPLPKSETSANADGPYSPSKRCTQTDLSSSPGLQLEPGTAQLTTVDHATQHSQTPSVGEAALSEPEGLQPILHGQAQLPDPATMPSSVTVSQETASDAVGPACEPAADLTSHTQTGQPSLDSSSQSADSDLSSSTVTQTGLVPGAPQAEGTSTPQSEAEGHAQVQDTSLHSGMPLTPVLLAAQGDGSLLNAIQTPLGSPQQGIQAERQAAATVESAVRMHGITDTNMGSPAASQLGLGPSGADPLPVIEAEPEGSSESERHTHGQSQSDEEEKAGPQRKEQFSLEIVRCKIVCPAKVDAAGYTDADPSPLDHTLCMEIPQFLLQLPLLQPAQHPRPHPVDLNIRQVLQGRQAAVPAPDLTAPSPFAATGQQGTIFSLRSLALFVALPEEFESAHLAPSESAGRTQLPPFLSIPTASLSALPQHAPPQHPALQSHMPDEHVPTFELEIRTAEVIGKPAQLQTVSASTLRYRTEMDIILGRPPSNPVEAGLAATADAALASGNIRQPLGQPVQRPGFAVEASVGLINLQLHSSNKLLPALVLQWQRLSAHWSQAAGLSVNPAHTACGLTWNFLSLQLTDNPAEPQQQFSLEHVGTLRSGSLALPGRMSRVHSEPLGGHGPPSSSRSSHHGSGRLTRGSSVHGPGRRQAAITRPMSPEEEFSGQGLSNLHFAPLGNGRSGHGLTGLAEIAADDDASSPSSPQYIVNNRARLASDSFAEAVEGILPSLSALSLNKPSQQQQGGSDDASSSFSDSQSRSRKHHGLDRLHSLTRGTSIASSTLSLGELQRQVPVIRHRSVMVAPAPPTPFAGTPDLPPRLASASSAFHLSSFASSSRQGLSIFGDASLGSAGRAVEDGMPMSRGDPDFSPKAWSANDLPEGNRLLLLLGSKGCFAADDSSGQSTTDASVGCSLRPLVSEPDQSSGAHSALEICASDMLLRIYLEGWQLLITTSQECFESVVKGQQRLQQYTNAQMQSGQVSSSSSSFVAAAAAVGSHTSVQLHATELVAELVANISRGYSACSPCLSLSAAMLIDSHTNADAQLQHCLTVPRMAVATALMELPSMFSVHNGGVLLGANHLQAVLTLPIPEHLTGTAPPGVDSIAESGGGGSERETVSGPSVCALDLKLQQLSVYASQRRLCIAAAVANACQEVQEGLLMLARPKAKSIAADIAPAPKAPSPMTFDALLKTCCSLQADSIALLLSNDKYDTDDPIVEAAVSNLALELSGQPLAQQLASSCAMTLHVDVYNNGMMGWESLVEPWASCVTLAIPLTRQGGQEVSRLVPKQLSLTLKADDVLELTLTQAVIESSTAAQSVLNDVMLVISEPESLEDVISIHENQNPGGDVLYWLQNLTDMPIEFWTRGPGQGHRGLPIAFRPSDLGNGCDVAPGTSESVIPLSTAMFFCKGRHVADPHTFLASSADAHITAASSSAEDTAQSLAVEPVSSHRQEGLKVLVRVEGQGSEGQPLGPWALDVEQRSMEEVQICMPAAGGGQVLQSFKLCCQVERSPRGGAGLTLHSGIKLHNSCGLLLSIGMQQRWPGGMTDNQTWTTCLVAPGSSAWLPALCCNATYLSLQPADEEERPSTHHWCAGVPLLQLLHQAEHAFPRSYCQDLVCSPVNNHSYPAHFCLGAAADPLTQEYSFLVRAPIEVYNALPMPLTVMLSSSNPDRSSLPSSVLVQPLQSCMLHQAGAFHELGTVQLEPTGYANSPAMGVPHGPPAHNGAGYLGYDILGKASVQVTKQRRQDGSASLSLCHCYDTKSGGHVLRVSCSLWVFNCTGLPIALRQSWLAEGFGKQEHLRKDTQADAVPTAWVPPYKGSSQQHLPSAPSSRPRRHLNNPNPTLSQSSQSSSMAGRMSGRFNLSGLGEVLTSPSVHSQWGPTQQSSIGSNPKGLSDTGQVAVCYQTPTRYASMQGDVEAHRQKVRLQLCATTATSQTGQPFWSSPVQLDALGGAAVVEAPCPMMAAPNHKEAQAGFQLAVTAVQIPNGDGALALHVMPRYILHNNLQEGVQYKQQGTNIERDLLAGGARAVHWPDVYKPKLQLCLRLHAAGWQWSGGFAVDLPGDLFVKIRHREQEVTRLVRVDVSTSANGVLTVALSEQEKGFAPYRLDNCTGLKLHLRQKGCTEQDDLLRPYSSLDYAWDEPALPHKLLLELPGNRRLGEYDLDSVGHHWFVNVAATSQRAEQRIMVCVRADGPKRVLELIDLLVHDLSSSAQHELVRGQLGWEPWSGTLYPGQGIRAAAGSSPALAGTSLKIQLQLGGLGVSIVSQQAELLYGRITGIQARAVTGVARQTLQLALQQLQVDNPLQDAAYPVMITAPNTQSSYGLMATAVAAAATAAIPKPAALCLRLSLWRSRPGGVTCVERLEVQSAPLLLELEQMHAMQLMQVGRSMLAPLTDDSAQAIRVGQPHEPDLMVLRAGGRQRLVQEKVYIEYLHISQLQITLSFLPSPGVYSGLQWLISVAGELDKGTVTLAVLNLHHPLVSRQALVQLLHSHYMRAALPKLLKIMGHANVLGSPLSVIHHLGLGVWSFLASPAQGLKESTQGGGLNLPRLFDGFAEGSRSLASNLALAVSTATSKTTETARRGLVSLGLDKLEATAEPLRQRLQLAGSPQPASSSGPGFLPAVAQGFKGFVLEPIRGVEQQGLQGLPFGIMKGTLGLFGHPLGSLLGTAASLSGSIRTTLLGVAVLPPRLRPPRHVSTRQPLSIYSYINALGRALLRTLEGGKYSHEGYVTCRQLSAPKGYLIITRVHVIAVQLPHLATSRWAPTLTWAVALGDLQHCKKRNNSSHTLALLVMQPEVNLLESQQRLAQKALGLRPPARSPWCLHTASFQTTSDIDEVLRAVDQGRKHVCWYGLLPVLKSGYLGSSWCQGSLLQDQRMQEQAQ